jgi:hypothetical protein
MSIGNFVIGGILVAIGVAFVIKAFYLNHHVFFLGWAEQKWGPGSGTMAYRWIGVALAALGMFCILGIVDIYGTAFGGKQSGSSSRNNSKSQVIKKKNNYGNEKNGVIAP